MESKETFTADEIKSLIEDLDISVEFVDQDSDEEFQILECELEEFNFSCVMFPGDGEVDRIMLMSIRFMDSNPFKFSNTFNVAHQSCSSYVRLDDDGDVFIDHDGDFWVGVRCLHFFRGGVTPRHVQSLVTSWIEDLEDFYEIEEDLSFPELSEEVEEMNLTQQIEWALGDKVKRSARELAGYLMLDRHDINSALYKNKDMFVKDAGQPPRWTLNS